jgi:hypothetical protein
MAMEVERVAQSFRGRAFITQTLRVYFFRRANNGQASISRRNAFRKGAELPVTAGLGSDFMARDGRRNINALLVTSARA